MGKAVRIGDRWVGERHLVYIVAEIGINHNGDLEMAKKLIDAAVHAGCDAVKFQKRTPEFCVVPEQRYIRRKTPWGYVTYLEYRKKIELSFEMYQEIDCYCKEKGIPWFASCWDEPSVDFIEQFDVLAYKVPSAALTDISLLMRLKRRPAGKNVILSTGMSTMEQM